MPSKSKRAVPSPFSQRSAFDEALSKPLVRRGEETDDGARRGRPPPQKAGYRPPSAAPSSVSSVVSSDDEGAPPSGGGRDPIPGFDPALSAAWASAGDEDGAAELREGLLREQEAAIRYRDMEEELLRERHTELADVTRNMGIVAEIHRDLATIVHSQQSDIDDVEANAAETAQAAETGLEHLERARGHMRSGGRWGVTFVGTLAVAAIVATVFFWLLAR